MKRRQFLYKAFYFTMLACTPVLIVGCDVKKKVLIVYINDASASAGKGRDDFRHSFEQAVINAGGSPNEIAIVRMENESDLIWAGPLRSTKIVKEKLKAANINSTSIGTDVCAALMYVRTVLKDAKYTGYQKIVVGYTDLIADSDTVHHKTFADPLKFDWEGVSAEFHLYGLPADRVGLVQKAWKGQTVKAHPANFIFSPEDIGFPSGAI